MLDGQFGVFAGGVADVGFGGRVEVCRVADFIGDVAQAAVEAEVAAGEQVAHAGPEVVAGRVPLPGFERVGVPALGAQLIAQQAQVNLVVGREAVGAKGAERSQVFPGESVVALPLGGVGNHQQRIVPMVALAGSVVGILPPQGFNKLTLKSIEAGIGVGGGGFGFIGLGTAGQGQGQQR